MLTDTSTWSHARGNEVVPSRWQATAETQHFRIRGPPRQLHQVRYSGSRDQSRFRASVQASRYFTEMPRVAAKAATRACQQRRSGVRIPSAPPKHQVGMETDNTQRPALEPVLSLSELAARLRVMPLVLTCDASWTTAVPGQGGC